MKWQSVEKILKKLSNKLWFERIIQNLINSVLIFSFITLIMVLISHFTPIVYLYKKMLYLLGFIVMIFAVKSVFEKPTIKKAAVVGDKTGLDERLITYVEYMDDDSDMALVFKEEVENEIQDYDILKKYRYNFKFKYIIISAMILVIAFGSSFIPTESRKSSMEMEKVNKELRKEARKINSRGKTLANKCKDEKQKEQLLSILDDLNKNLKKTYDYKKAAAEISQSEEKLDDLKYSQNREMLRQLSGMFKGTSLENSKFAKALENGNFSNAENMSDNIKFSQKDKDKVIKNAKEIADSGKFNDNKFSKEIKDKLDNKELNSKNIVDAVKKASNKSDITIPNKEKMKLDKAKEKFLAKSNGKDIKDTIGNSKSNSFALGDRKSYKNAEKSNINKGENRSGGDGSQAKEDNNAVGGSSNRVLKSRVSEKANEGTIGKYKKSVDTLRKNNDISNVKGKTCKDGGIYKKDVQEVIAKNGRYKPMENKWLEYKKEGMNYVWKYEVPIDKQDLVVKYFKALNGGVKGGNH
ncbi:hypothetical protein ACFIJ5_12685 [Haloimpatiens sp. FM7330]|uniref:hypothetical protein n=1 Tax=Haloimpatiens sp. FM7330 TaxID=3298610 RepID=UPI0036387303